ncbi:reverse transcriptase domain-containing protein [Tanacetum coccineum]
MTNGRETTPPPGFSTPPHIPNINTTERPPVTTTVFAATTPGNTPFAYRASTLTYPSPMIGLAFVEANYEILESILRDRRRVVDMCKKGVGFKEVQAGKGSRIGRNNELRLVIPSLGEPLPTLHKEDPTGSVTPFVCWIKDYPLPNALKMPTHVGSYDGKGDLDNFLHLFEGVIRMQKWLMHVACHMLTYTLKDSARIWWNSQKAGYILNYEDLKAKFRSHFSQQKRFTKMHFPVHSIKQREGESVRAFATRSQIEEAMRSGQLSHLVKGIKKERTKTSDSQRGEKKEKITTPAKALILMINQEEAHIRNSISKSPTFKGREITFSLVTKGSNSSAPVIIKDKIFRKEVGRVHMDSGSSCEVIYEHCFLKLKPSIQASMVDLHVLLVGFLGEKSWAIGEVFLEIMIGNAPLTRSETLNFVIVRSNYPYDMLLGRIAMQKIGMVVSTIHRAVKFHTT